jgi:hypothetical protein
LGRVGRAQNLLKNQDDFLSLEPFFSLVFSSFKQSMHILRPVLTLLPYRSIVPQVSQDILDILSSN